MRGYFDDKFNIYMILEVAVNGELGKYRKQQINNRFTEKM